LIVTPPLPRAIAHAKIYIGTFGTLQPVLDTTEYFYIPPETFIAHYNAAPNTETNAAPRNHAPF